MSIVLANNAHTTLAANISSTDTTIYVDDVDSFPTLGSGEYFYCTIESTTGTYEIVKVTQTNSTSFLVTRAQEGTIAVPFNIGARVELRVTVQSLEDHFGDVVDTVVDDALTAAIPDYISDTAYASSWDGVTGIAPSKNAVYDKIDSLDTAITAFGSVVSLRGTWDASAGTFPGSGSALSGYSYIVSVGGTVDSVTFNVGDRIIAITDNASTSTYASNWFKADYTDAVSSVAGRTGAVVITTSDLADYTAANILTLVKTVDGASSGLDADLLDGYEAAAFALLTGSTFTGDVTVTTGVFNVGKSASPPTDASLYLNYDSSPGVGKILWARNGTTEWYLSSATSSMFLRNNGLGTNAISFAIADNAATFTGSVTVPDDAYAVGWDSNTTVPTKNAVYDKIEGLSAVYQPLDADLTTWAGLTPSANAQSLVTAANYAAMRALLDLEAGTDFYSISAANAAFQPLDSDLTSWAAITRASGFDTFTTTPSSVNLKSLVTDETGSGSLVFGTSPTIATPTITGNMTLSSGGINSAGTVYIAGGSLGSGNGLHTFFNTAGYIYSVENGVSWRDLSLDGASLYLNYSSTGTVYVGSGGLQAAPAISSETTGALTSASRNRIVRCSGNVTLPSSGMSDGDSILIDPRGTARTITRPGSHTMYIANTDSATGTTGAHNVVTAVYHGSSKWTVQGSVS